MDPRPLITVVIPIYKVENYLRQCVDSVLVQSYDNLEILLVDDGSPDRCGEICEEYASRDSRITVIHKENGGLSSARNAGIEAAAGEYIVFLDSDDWVEPEAYGTLLALAEKTGASMVIGGRYDYDENTGSRTRGLCPEKEEVLDPGQAMKRMFAWNQCDSAAWDKLYKRSLFSDIRYPEGKYFEDIPTTYRLMGKAGKIAMLPWPIYNYRHRAGSITVSSLSPRTFHHEENTRDIYPYICAHYPEAQREARFLRVRSLRFCVLSVELADGDSRRKFRGEMIACRRELRKHTWFMLTSPLFERQERLQDLALAWGFYRPIHQLRHSHKQKRDHS